MEILVSMGVSALLFISLYAGFSSGWMVTEVARENLRATQIMVEKMETIRLYNWAQINSNGFIPPVFVDTYYPYTTNTSYKGLSYTGTVSITAAPISASYSNNMRLMTMDLRWTSGNIERHRRMQTLISRYGLQTYVY